ncbi:MAG TPA: hypothetical protein VEZ51_00650 [Gemmatimonadaceae bacterium]|nr:hypothetical protein [Gemmatimonadaceae bacterium]
MSIKSFYVGALLAFTACASSGAPAAGPRRDPNVITHEEFVASNEGNAFDAIARLRPLFLKSRGRTTINADANDFPIVFVDGQRYGDLNSLRNLVAAQILEARHLGATDAVGKYGMQYGGGVIEITTR